MASLATEVIEKLKMAGVLTPEFNQACLVLAETREKFIRFMLANDIREQAANEVFWQALREMTEGE